MDGPGRREISDLSRIVWRGYREVMGIRRSAVIEAPVDEVFAWFSRPGAFARLQAPWLPMRLRSQASSLADGVTVIDLPGGLQWFARHDPAAFVPGRRFVDEVAADGLRSLPVGVFPWRHVHDFEPVDAARTRVIDEVRTPVPEQLLSEAIEFRYRRLAGDLAAHRRAAQAGLPPSTVAVTGASGLVGSALTAFLSTGGHRVLSLVRGEPRSESERAWDPAAPDPAALRGVDAVIHLAGASIAGRFTDAHKTLIADSRIEPTRLLARAAAQAGVPVFVSASAVGWYGRDRGDELLTEDAAPPEASDFLSDLVRRWEGAAHDGAGADTRVVTVRTGIVQSPQGGTLKLLLPLFRAGLGGRLGSGEQWQPWIGIDDLVDIYHRSLWDGGLSGPVNAVAPGVVRNSAYTRELGRAVHRPTLLPVPSFGPALLLGREGAEDLALASQRVRPTVLEDRGHPFRHPDLGGALRHLLGG
ncbi:Epimerase family protein OS=Tsukamurella paurometabola (strain ATCC 8368 / DSM 20162 / CCUG 35730 / CIP 100753 / JCM 10117 / KCTC 9821 / NBRC 16120 / NCIMB 702349 / NCTC 13040) OX=521096 GN=Tpau_3582 PE=3 SV=1 [Tsukamurella paurometabola]|nr:Epimerase family protein SA0724 [Tsukamurella paurometabola]